MAATKKSDETSSPLSTPSTWWTLRKAFQGTNNRNLTRKDVPYQDLTGKWIIITGSNNGIGREAAFYFAKCGANLLLACRSEPPPHEKHPQQVLEECISIARSAHHLASTLEWWEIDMARLSTVKSFARRWLATGRPLDILCNNAGMGENNPGGPSSSPNFSFLTTEDGFEMIHQVNFLSHVLLTRELLPSIERAAEPRIVCTTSCMTFLGRYDLRNWDGTGCLPDQLYRNNKLYFQIWLCELQERFLRSERRRHITVNGVHPGFVDTGIFTGPKLRSSHRSSGGSSWIGRLVDTIVILLISLFAIDAEQGSYAITHAATSVEGGPDPQRQGAGARGGKGGGRYFNRIWAVKNMPHCYDDRCRREVWEKANGELELSEE